MKARDPETDELIDIPDEEIPPRLPLRWVRDSEGSTEEKVTMVGPDDEGWETAVDDWVKAELGLIPEDEDSGED